jgi:hypothetical protein
MGYAARTFRFGHYRLWSSAGDPEQHNDTFSRRTGGQISEAHGGHPCPADITESPTAMRTDRLQPSLTDYPALAVDAHGGSSRLE